MRFTVLTSEWPFAQLERTTPERLLNVEECHVWVSATDYAPGEMARLQEVLSEQEVRQANAFRRPEDRRLYQVAHGLLRLILARYTGTAAACIEFSRGPGAKPTLSVASPTVRFNLSHAGERVIIAVCSEEIGVDIELIQPNFEWQDIAEHYFSPSELAALREAGPIQSTALFYTYWTRKEAWLKAIGLGLVDDLPRINVSKLNNSFWLADKRLSSEVHSTWQVATFPLEGNYLASLAYPPSIQTIALYEASSLIGF
jgi:4'-phosphopantetheinyl transferase